MKSVSRFGFVHELFLPTLLFAALGGMTWAVRGCSGFGGSAGCIFAGVMWGAAWWFIAREPGREPTRRYTSAWIVLAVTVGIGMSGARGWMQWPHFFDGKLMTNYGQGESVPISRAYGFVWMFIAGMPWAGLGACLLAWCGSLRETRIWHWLLRLCLGIGGAFLAHYLIVHFPQYFMPLYESLEDRYNDLPNNPNLRRLINDNRAAIMHLGLYLGLLTYEFVRRDWKNAVLILTVGIVNGAGWAAFQNWKWAPQTWPDGQFNWWRCWESSGGISIGVALGIAWFLVNRPMSAAEQSIVRARRSIAGPNLEWLGVYLILAILTGLFLGEEEGLWGKLRVEDFRQEDVWRVLFVDGGGAWGVVAVAVAMLFGLTYYALRRGVFYRQPAAENEALGDPNLQRISLYFGLLLGLGYSVRNGLKGWFNLYRTDEKESYWDARIWEIVGPTCLVLLLALCVWALWRPLARNFRGDLFPRAGVLVWLVLVVQNVIAQLITGPLDHWNEFAFSIYYVLLFAITAVIVIHYGERAYYLAAPIPSEPKKS